jgi:predicted nucleic acid-binding protein
MTLVDTGPIVALFDPRDRWHSRCIATLKGISGRMWTTVPVLTEAFHLLSPASPGAQGLMDFVRDGGLAVWFLSDESVQRALELMVQYSTQPMDFADASLVVAAESLSTRRIFTIDRKDFDVYRIQRGHRKVSF